MVSVALQKKAFEPAYWNEPFPPFLNPPGSAENPNSFEPLPLLYQPETDFKSSPAFESPPNWSVSEVHSSSDGTCQPEGQSPLASLRANATR